MKIYHFLVLFLCLLALGLCGCLSSSEASSSPLLAGASLEETGAPTVLVPEREPLTPLEIALGLDYEVSETKMGEIAERVRKEGRFAGQTCGMDFWERGKPRGAYWDHFSLKIAGAEESKVVILGYTKPTYLYFVRVRDFEYRLGDFAFRRTRRSSEQ